jgi:hypothetical protein
MIVELTNAIRSRQISNPRTVLGFYAGVIALLLAGDVAAVGVLASAKIETFLIPWLLGFAGAMILLLLLGVFIVTLIDPSKLMLGQITGTEYADIHRITLGDSDSGGRRVEAVNIVPSETAIIAPKALSAAEELIEGEGDE